MPPVSFSAVLEALYELCQFAADIIGNLIRAQCFYSRLILRIRMQVDKDLSTAVPHEHIQITVLLKDAYIEACGHYPGNIAVKYPRCLVVVFREYHVFFMENHAVSTGKLCYRILYHRTGESLPFL